MIKATAVLITTKTEYPQEVLDHLKDDFDEVLICTESPNVYQRYVLASKARNDIIYVQDDDALLDHNELFKHYDGRLTNAITEHHHNYYKDSGATLVGWGCFFPKKMLASFGKYVDKYGLDFHLYREADRIFTYLNQPHNTIIGPHEDLNQLDRMSHEPRHYEYMREALEKLRLL